MRAWLQCAFQYASQRNRRRRHVEWKYREHEPSKQNNFVKVFQPQLWENTFFRCIFKYHNIQHFDDLKRKILFYEVETSFFTHFVWKNFFTHVKTLIFYRWKNYKLILFQNFSYTTVILQLMILFKFSNLNRDRSKSLSTLRLNYKKVLMKLPRKKAEKIKTKVYLIRWNIIDQFLNLDNSHFTSFAHWLIEIASSLAENNITSFVRFPCLFEGSNSSIFVIFLNILEN